VLLNWACAYQKGKDYVDDEVEGVDEWLCLEALEALLSIARSCPSNLGWLAKHKAFHQVGCP
jgi:hypothetical protein